MEYLNNYEGAVFFVNILGMRALTQEELDLDVEDYESWLSYYDLDFSSQTLAMAILGKFRDILNNLANEYPYVTISQRSDSAFIWSENVQNVILVANQIMSQCIKNGILCRGGLAYGEILESLQNQKLGRFVVGKAVSEAVKLEGLAKGARILITSSLAPALYSQNKEFSTKIHLLFQTFVNPLDYNSYEEFKWYIVPFMDLNLKDLTAANKAYKILLTRSRLKLSIRLQALPKFSWNTKSAEGLVHLKATIHFMSENNRLGVEHNFDWVDIGSRRSEANIKKIEDLINKEIT